MTYAKRAAARTGQPFKKLYLLYFYNKFNFGDRMDTCIKNINEKEWNYFKTESARNRTTMGKFFGILIETYRKTKEKSTGWESILKGKEFISKKEAIELKKASSKFRKGFDFR